MTRRLILALAPAAALAFAASLAQAQPAGPPPPAAPTAEIQARHEAMRKQHLEDMKTVLRLRPDQEAAFAAFVNSHAPQARDRRGPEAPKALTTPQRLDQMAKRETDRNARRDQSAQALKTFYAALSPDQQKVFDALQRLKGPPGGRMMKHDGHRGGGGKMAMRGHGGRDSLR